MPFGMVGQVGWWMTFNGGWVLGAHVALQHESPTLTLMPNPSPNITHTHTHTAVLRLCGICPGQAR